MASSKLVLSPEEYNVFHSIDRKLYTVLVSDLCRDPLESIKIMAVWLWLERAGFYNLIPKISNLPHPLINKVAEEAATCLKCINDPDFDFTADTSEIPLLHYLMNKELTLMFLNKNRKNALLELPNIIADVCIKTLSDIMNIAIKRHVDAAVAAQALSDRQMLIPLAPSSPKSIIHGLAQLSERQMPIPLVRPTPESIIRGLATGQNAEEEAPPEDRTMFVTFSKGYPVAEWEVRDFFTQMFGDCIENLFMQEVKPTEQALFARVVFYSPSVMQVILNGVTKAKFTIKGKHVWMRKYVPKPIRNSPTSSPPRKMSSATVY